MSKSLTDEYKIVMQEEVPDLWARIEASLPEKNLNNDLNKKDLNINKSCNNVIDISEVRDKKTDTLELKRKKNKKIMKFVYSMSGVAVAGIAIAILIPFISDSNDRTKAALQANKTKDFYVSDNAKDTTSKSEAAVTVAADEATINSDSNYEFEDYSSRADQAAGISEETTILDGYDNSEAVNDETGLLNYYKDVTFEYLGEAKMGNIKVYEIMVIECNDNPELLGLVIYVDDIKGLETEDVSTYDLSLVETVDGVNIYSLK